MYFNNSCQKYSNYLDCQQVQECISTQVLNLESLKFETQGIKNKLTVWIMIQYEIEDRNLLENTQK